MSSVNRKDPFLISTLVIATLLISSFASMALTPNSVIQGSERVVAKDNIMLQSASATPEGNGEGGGGDQNGDEGGGGDGETEGSDPIPNLTPILMMKLKLLMKPRLM